MKKTFTIAVLLVLSAVGKAQEIRLVSEGKNQLVITNTNNNLTFGTKVQNGREYADFMHITKVFTMDKGSPALPVYTNSVILPNQGMTSIVVTHDGFEEFDNVEVLPSKGSLKRNVDPAKVPYEQGVSYTQDAFYPGNLATMSDPYIFRDVRGTTISFHPYQYNPVTKKLRVYHNLSAQIITDPSRQGVNDKQQDRGAISTVFGQMYGSLFLNASSLYDSMEESGEMLIIAPSDYLETIAPLAEWKVKKGIKTTVVSLDDTGDSSGDVKDYIAEFYEENPGLIYVLLVGDHQELPCFSYGTSGGGEALWSDSYYAQIEGSDYLPEVLIGRFSGGVEDIQAMVDRTLEYETNPAEGDWMTRFAGIGSEEGEGYGDDGEPDWKHLRGIGNKLLDAGYTYINEFYDGTHGVNDAASNPDPSMISDAVNEGVGLINYCGHGAQDIFVTGSYTSTDVLGLENMGKYPFVVSVACNNGTFTTGTSICEEWVRAHTVLGFPTGAIAACGSTILMAWAEPMQTQDEMAELISDPFGAKTTLGGLFYNGQLSMLETYGMSETAVEVMQTWVFFGDPSVVFRNKETLELNAEHLPNIGTDADVLGVTCDVEGAVISVTQNGVIIGTGVISGGEVVIELADYTAGTPLTVIATQQNYLPYQGTVATGTMGTNLFAAEAFALYPNPAKDFITVKAGNSINEANVEVRDMTGKLIFASLRASFENNAYIVDTSSYASGVYLFTVQNNDGKAVKRFVVR